MSIILKHVLRNIRENGFRSFLIVFSLALSASVFYINLNIREDVYKSSKIILEAAFGGYDILLSGDLSYKDEVLPGTEKTLPLTASVGITDSELRAVLYETDLAQVVREGTVEISDRMPGFTPNALYHSVISAGKAEKFGLELGDIIAVVTEDETVHPVMITAFAEELGFFTQSDGSVLEILTCTGETEPAVLYAALLDDESPSAVCDGINALNLGITATALRRDSSAQNLDSIQKLLSIILFLVIAISVYVVSGTQSLIIQYRIPVLGTFRSLGATAAATNRILILENVMYGAAALVPGLFFGEVLRRLVNKIYLGGDTSSIHWLYMLPVLLFTVGLNVLVVLFSILRSGRKSIRELIFGKQSAAKKPPVLQGIAGLLLFGFSVWLAYRNTHYVFGILLAEMLTAVVGAGLAIGPIASWFSALFHRPVRALFGGPSWLGLRDLSVSKINRSTSLLVATVMAMVLMIYVVVASVTGFFTEYANNYPYDIMIKHSSGDEASFQYIEELDGVDSVIYEYWDFDTAEINGLEKNVCFCAVDGFSNGIEAEEGLFESLNNGETVLDKMFASVNDFSIGDRLTFLMEDGREFSLRVTGLCDSGIFNSSRITVMMTREDFYSFISVNPAIVGIDTDRDVHELITDINQAVYDKTGEVYDVMAKDDYLGAEIDDAMNGMKAVSAMPFLAILLALFGMVNNQLVAFNQNRFRYAMLYSASMSRRQLASSVFAELFYSFAIGSAVGVGLSLWLSKVIRDIIYVSISYVPLVITAKQLLLSFLLLFILLCLTAVFPLMRLRKLDIIREIKY